jgi:hypothetical protein
MMTSTRLLLVPFVLACAISPASAQSPAPAPAAPVDSATPAFHDASGANDALRTPPLTQPPAPDVQFILGGADNPAFHVYGGVDAGIYSFHGAGGASGPQLGAGAGLGISHGDWSVELNGMRFDTFGNRAESWSMTNHP